jgi:hypothetical protein
MSAGAGPGPAPDAGAADADSSFGRPRPWAARDAAILGLGLVAGLVARVLLLPAEGLVGDLDQFVRWVHGLATGPFGNAYDQNLSFPPVMVYVWGFLAALEPAFRTVTDSSDPAIRAVMKLPASLADLGLAAGVAWVLRARPAWAVLGALGIALHPAVIDVSAWWGQYESLYVLPALGAFIAAAAGRRDVAAALIAISLMTKPQALPLLVPFGAWFLATGGWRGAGRAAAIGLATIVALWLPFLGADGPAGYLRNLGEYQGDIFAFLSLRAWNPWWLLQEIAAGGGFVADSSAVLGPITLRHLGFAAAGLLELVVLLAVGRDPRPRTLALGLAAASLVAFAALTTMHERYAFAALVFLPLALPDRRVLGVWVGFGILFTLNLLWAIPPSAPFEAALTDVRLWGFVGPIGMIALTIAVVGLLLEASRAGRASATEPTTA